MLHLFNLLSLTTPKNQLQGYIFYFKSSITILKFKILILYLIPSSKESIGCYSSFLHFIYNFNYNLLKTNFLVCSNNGNCQKYEACFNTMCINPCNFKFYCAKSAFCHVVNHIAVCSCPRNYSGSPRVHCERGNH